jgi:hypothetical protein
MGQFEPDRTHERTHVRGRHDLTLASRVCALALMLPVAHLRLGCDVAMRERRLGDVFGCAAGSVGVRGGVGVDVEKGELARVVEHCRWG